MKIVFLQKDSFVKLAVEQLCAVLKVEGHSCDLFIKSGENDFLTQVLSSGADLLAFSCTTGGERWVSQTAARIKAKSNIPIIVGGPHTTFFPQMIEDPNIDFICRGEGEFALLELADALEHDQQRIREIPNIWSKDPSGNIHRTEIRPLIQDLDQLPFPDFSVYTKYSYMVPYSLDMFPVMTGRGCPNNCSYCFNKRFKELHRGKGKYVRRRNPENVARELKQAVDNYGVRQFNFVDDSFFLFSEWVRSFHGAYLNHVGRRPFIVNAEASQVKEDLVELLKDMGCICIRMGVETGSESLRNGLLKKNITDDQIRKAAGYIKKNKILLSTYNILGLPGETLDDALRTMMLNREIRSDLVWCSLLQPYPGTEINDYVSEHDLLSDRNDQPDLSESFFASSQIRLSNKKEIVNLQKLMQILVQARIPESATRNIIALPNNRLFDLAFRISFILSKIRTQRLRIIPLIKMGLHSLSYMK